ncbi:amino acid permease [Caballeronia jiangsuensis]|nr:amino acid permease [Caballeronia jiangsuensis]
MSLFRKKNIEHMLAGAHSTSLKKTLGALDLTFLGIGAIIGTGIFVLTGTGAVQAGPALMISFLVAAIACCFAALAYAEFSSTIPVAGSIYTYSYATLGELAAWIIGWDLMLEYGLATSAVSVGWSGYLQSLLSGFGISLPTALSAAPGALPGHVTFFNLPAFLVMMAITALLSVGVKESTRINNIMVAIKVTVVLLVIAVGVFHVKPANWHPFMPNGWSGVFGAAAVMFFAFIGFDSVSSAAEEVKNPKRDLPIGIISSLAVCAVLYVAVAAVVTGIVPAAQFANNPHPVSFALQMAGQNWVAGFIDLGAVLGMLTVILVMSYGQTRVIYAMSRDGLLPARLSKVHPRFATPFFTTWIVGIFFGLIGALVPLNVLAELINIGTLAAFSMVSIAVLILRRTHPELPRAFRCPGVPVVPVLAVASCLFLMANLQAMTWIAFAVWLVIGLAIYFAYSRRHSVLGRAPLEAPHAATAVSTQKKRETVTH